MLLPVHARTLLGPGSPSTAGFLPPLIARINARHLALQHAIDGLHPFTDDANAPVRHLFALPTDRPFNG